MVVIRSMVENGLGFICFFFSFKDYSVDILIKSSLGDGIKSLLGVWFFDVVINEFGCVWFWEV